MNFNLVKNIEVLVILSVNVIMDGVGSFKENYDDLDIVESIFRN